MRLADDAGEADLRKTIFAGHGYVRHEMYRALPASIDGTISRLADAYAAYRRFETAATPHNQRSALVQAFLYTAFNSIVSSSFLLLSGMLPPAGNQMRHFGEAFAMALLCSDPRIDAYIRVTKAPDQFPYHEALHLVNKKENRRKLGLRDDFWRAFMQVTKFFDNYSHGGLFTYMSTTMTSQPALLAFIGEFDPGRVDHYEKEWRVRESGARVLALVMEALQQRLPFDRNAATPAPAT